MAFVRARTEYQTLEFVFALQVFVGKVLGQLHRIQSQIAPVKHHTQYSIAIHSTN